MSTEQIIAAAGIVPALRNSEAEACAQSLAAVIFDKVKRQEVFAAYRDTHPALKNWEAQAIGQRAICIAKERALNNAHGQAVENAMLSKHANVI